MEIEHISGQKNFLVDSLTRDLQANIVSVQTITEMASSSSYTDADINILEMKRKLALLDLELAEKDKALQ
ncbi:hypothetical protein ACLOJK_018876 [Asimina triloba]